MATSRTKQPEWRDPAATAGAAEPRLRLYNSLTRTKTEFVPIEGRKVTWYCCGPTTYDWSHMGHARNYVSTDIIRRVLRDYFGYDVFFVQNVTDIDDKIILRARQGYLLAQYRAANAAVTPELTAKVAAAWTAYAGAHLPAAPAEPGAFAAWAAGVDTAEAGRADPKFAMHFGALREAAAALAAPADGAALVDAAASVLAPVLDAEGGAGVNDPAIFADLPAYWEARFDEDMQLLNVLPPTVTTRVSEYVPEIVAFVEQMAANGYAYAAEGSVYFDTAAFEAGGRHAYAKLQPWNRGQKDLIDEGEGSLARAAGGKKSLNDFALWKASKAGEPAWDSPWGKGRPGWHIECSVMASAVLGSNIDIHTGGIDLAFPHHDNELAQSEAYHDCPQWVNYFLHMGHLHIEGHKMSKSLKNFMTIREALAKNSARQLRLALALQQWNANFDFKESLLAEVKTLESSFSNFFTVVRALAVDQAASVKQGRRVPQPFGPAERQLVADLDRARAAVHAALCDNVATPAALQALADLVGRANVYISAARAAASVSLLAETARYVTRILETFGFEAHPDRLGWAAAVAADAAAGSKEETVMPYVQVLSRLRDTVRKQAIAKAPYASILLECDRVRDVDLVDLGISLDDRDGDLGALVKFVDKAELLRQRAEKEDKERVKAERKQKAKDEEARKLRERLEKGKTDPKLMFRTPEYSAWDDAGLPTADKDGGEIAKSKAKKLKKEYDGQVKLHAEYLRSLEA
ncbi:cysteinyl-tRNA synthetase [Dipodascopsis tothii]|uniref:cysteinyl-tRNA synthetase n=1 Tax=Dipodascopsis tothii TaxID=44089 RepID=UPI0034CEF910